MKVKEVKAIPIQKSPLRLTIKIAIPVLALLGTAISGYLTYIHYQALNSICLFGAKCDTVLTSQYSTMWGVPLSLFGLVMYIVLLALSLFSLRAKGDWEDRLALGTYAVALSGILFTVYLYYLEIFVLHAFCSWCMVSSIVLASIFVLSVINLFSGRQAVKEKSHPRRFKLSNYIQW